MFYEYLDMHTCYDVHACVCVYKYIQYIYIYIYIYTRFNGHSGRMAQSMKAVEQILNLGGNRVDISGLQSKERTPYDSEPTNSRCGLEIIDDRGGLRHDSDITL